jgi:hypothetical protein
MRQQLYREEGERRDELFLLSGRGGQIHRGRREEEGGRIRRVAIAGRSLS